MSTQVRLTMVGALTVSCAGRVWATTNVGSRKARTLLALLAVESGRLVSVDRITEVLWGHEPPRRPAANVSTLVSRLRMAFGADLILGGRSGYRLGPAGRTDLAEAADTLAEAHRLLTGQEPAGALALAREVIAALAAGRVLECEGDAPWADPLRARHVILLREARQVAAESALRTWNAVAARAICEEAVRADPFDESAYRLLMRAHLAAGEPGRALAAYQRLRTALAEELGADPAAATSELHLAVLRGRASPWGASAERSTFIGREDEVACLMSAWKAAMVDGPRIVLVSGEAGIGKTALAGHFASLAAGGVLARARCCEAERALFLQPFIELLTQLAGSVPEEELPELLDGYADALGTLLPGIAGSPRLPRPVRRRRLFEAVTAFLRRFSARHPTLLIIDDLHHADLPAIELLHYLGRHAVPSRLLVVATVGVEDGRVVDNLLAPVAHRVELGPLDAATITRLAGSAELAAGLQERTGGHPLFVVELLAAREPGIPATLREGLLSRVRRAGPQAEELLRAAAVVGQTFSPTAVARLLGIAPQEAARRCERVLRTRLIVLSGEGYAFGNRLIREIIDQSVPAPTRRVYRC